MKKWILKFYENDVIRYIFWGGCTTLVNLLSFYIMRAMGIPLMSATSYRSSWRSCLPML